MSRSEGVASIREACKSISKEMMKIHPAVPKLEDEETQNEIYKVLFELTERVEVIKKKLGKLEKKDASTDL